METQTVPAQWYHVKVREKGKRAWWFLSGKGGMIRLRIHAVQFQTLERAQAVVDEINRENPSVEAKVQSL